MKRYIEFIDDAKTSAVEQLNIFLENLSKGSIHKVAGYQANTDYTYILLEVENELSNQLDELQPIKVPQFVADWITHSKNIGRSLFGAMSIFEGNTEIKKWMQWADNQETFALAWIFGYEVEEKRYVVNLKNGQPLVKAPLGGNLYFNQNITAGNYKATRKQLEEAGFGWVFDCPGIEIEEVEE